MIGFDQAQIRRIKAQETMTRGLNLVSQIMDEDVVENEA
jgi:hypothetical protein